MASKFNAAVAELIHEKASFGAGLTSAVAHGSARAGCLAAALAELAAEHGVVLQRPLQIDSRGEFSIVAMPADGSAFACGAGPFGEVFSQLLNRHNPRTGISPGATLEPKSGWCSLNHFDVERLVLAQYELQIEAESQSGEGGDRLLQDRS